MKKSRQEALNRLKQAKSGETSRISQYQVEESKDLIIEMPESDYKKLVSERNKEKFIVDDLGIGYDDEGECDIESVSEDFEEFAENEPKVSSQSITSFMKPEMRKKPRLVPTAKKEKDLSYRNDLLDMIGDEDADVQKVMKVEFKEKKPVNNTIRKGESEVAFMKNYNIPISSLKTNQPEKVGKNLNLPEEVLKRPKPGDPLPVPEPVESIYKPEVVCDDFPIEPLNEQVTSMQIDNTLDPSTLEESLENMEIETTAIETLALEQNPEFKLVNNTLKLFWIDAVEDKELYPGKVFLFGKTETLNNPQKFVGVCVLISEVNRKIYLLPRPEFKENFEEINNELEFHRKQLGIRKWSKEVKPMKYCFELPGIEQVENYIEIEYSSNYPCFCPSNLRTIKHIFNSKLSIVENLIVHRKLKGPCWVKVVNPSKPKVKISNCRIELVVNSYTDIEIDLLDSNIPPPTISFLSISLKTRPNARNENEIFSISLKAHQKIELNSPTIDIAQQMASFSIINTGKESKCRDFESVTSEKHLIEKFLNLIDQVDPDIIAGHDLYSDMSDRLLSRIQTLKPNNISKLGRIFRTKAPTLRKDDLFTGNWQVRGLTAGRLLLDTLLSSKELAREKNYNLAELANNWFNIIMKEIDFDLIEIKENPNFALQLAKVGQEECNIVYLIVKRLNIIPLTKELTNIAGNLWIRSLQNQRAERNEMFLIHEFYSKGYIYPDKTELKFENKADKKKNQYSGGKVLEPISGLYDKIVILLDFNSLYPSIIREHNICFTTVQRSKSEDMKDNNDPGTITDGLPEGILPGIIGRLVEQRRQVKYVMKSEQNPSKLKQLDIKQTALKLTANSMYGCLGFKSSRFYARAIASLITQIGRNILERTVKLAKDSLNLEVIYGDTDSIMIHTGLDDVDSAIKKGQELKSLVNKQFKKLEIELDGVFKTMLLVKKKKYAALRIENGALKREIKGLDMVRRDWCDLSRNLSGKVLDIILSGNGKEDSAEKIKAEVESFYKNLDSKGLSEFIITKQLTKTIDKYKDAQTLPHVQVAIRLEKQYNKSLLKHFIPYVICEGESNSVAARAYHPDEIKSANNTLGIDKKWYITQQVIPPLSRLIAPINLIKIEEIVDLLGEDPLKYKPHVEVVKKIEKYSGIPINCKCSNLEHPGYDLAAADDNPNCPLCPKKPNADNYVKNFMKLFLKQKLLEVYKSEYRCTNIFECGRVTKVKVSRKCEKSGCSGVILPVPILGEFNVELARVWNLQNKFIEKNDLDIKNFKIIESAYNSSCYRKVDLGVFVGKTPNYQKLLR